MVLAVASIAAGYPSTKQHATTHHLDEASELALVRPVFEETVRPILMTLLILLSMFLPEASCPRELSLSSTSFGQVPD